jgi:hypothetical protein
MRRWRGGSSRKVNSLREISVLKRVVERHTLGARRGEDLGEPRRKRLIRKLVGPETEDAAGMEMGSEPFQTRGLIKVRVLRIEKEVRRMVDVDQDGIKPSSGFIGIKTLF